ncbi:hypothetical protein C5167_035804, partial [Papaver somniferum]
LESGIIETERQRSPVVISHQVEYYFSYANLAKSSKLVASEDGSRSGVKIHSPTQVWKDCRYIDVIRQLIDKAGDFVSDDIWYRVVQFVTNNKDLQHQKGREYLDKTAIHETMVKV